MGRTNKYSYRVEIMQQEPSEYDMGDQENVDEINEILDRDGLWAFSTQRLDNTVEGADWEDIDACAGFLGNDTEYMLDCACECLPRHMEGKWIDVVTDDGQECNPHRVRLGASSMAVLEVGQIVTLPDSQVPHVRYRVTKVCPKTYVLFGKFEGKSCVKTIKRTERTWSHKKAR